MKKHAPFSKKKPFFKKCPMFKITLHFQKKPHLPKKAPFSKKCAFSKKCTTYKKCTIFQKMQHLSKMPHFQKYALFSLGLTLSRPDVPAWAPEGLEGRSQEAQRACSKKSGPGGPLDFYSMIIWNGQKVNSSNSALKPLSRLPNVPKVTYVWDILIF